MDVAHMPPELLSAIVNIITIFVARIAFRRSENSVMMWCSDEISTVLIVNYGSKRSGAINCATDSRSRIKCISVPLTITSAARGRVL